MDGTVRTPPKARLLYGAIVETVGILGFLFPTLRADDGAFHIEPLFAVVGGALFVLGQFLVLSWVFAARRMRLAAIAEA